MVSADNTRARPFAVAPGGARRFGELQPAGWVMLAAAAAWGWMMIAPAHADGAHHGGHAPAAGLDLPGTLAMVVAMMLPLMIPALRRLAAADAGPRHRAAAGFLAGYLAVWMLAMPVITIAWAFAASLAGWTAAAVGAVAVAAAWEAARVIRGAGHGCADEPAVVGRGWRRDAACARFGAVAGVRCVGGCWALMAVCVAFAHGLPVMAAIFGVQMSGQYWRRGYPALAALVLTGIGVAALAARAAATGHVHAHG